MIQTENGPRIAVAQPRQVMTFDQALNHAAWIVLLTMREQDFIEVLNRIRSGK